MLQATDTQAFGVEPDRRKPNPSVRLILYPLLPLLQTLYVYSLGRLAELCFAPVPDIDVDPITLPRCHPALTEPFVSGS